MDRFLSRKDTKTLKGIAIVLMLIHHLWGFPYRLYGGELRSIFTLFGYPLPNILALFGRICVSMFMFLGGYGIYISCEGKEFDLVAKVKNLYLNFWKVFVIFIPIGFIFFRNQSIYAQDEAICNVFSSFDSNTFFMNFMGLEYDYNGEWWFFGSYLFAIITFPLARRIIKDRSAAVNIFLVIVFTVLWTKPMQLLAYNESLGVLDNVFLFGRIIFQSRFIGSFWMGMVCANNGLLDRLCKGLSSNKLLNPVVDILGCFVLILLRMQFDDSIEVLMVPLLIVLAMDLCRKCRLLESLFVGLGNESTNMWLIHSFFCYYFGSVAKIVTSLKWAVPSLLILIILSYVAALIVTAFWNQVGKIIDKFSGKLTPKEQL